MSENVPINALFRHNFHARLYVYPIPGQQNGQPSQVIAVLMKQADTPWNYKILIAWLPLHCPFPPCQRLTRDLRIFLCVDRPSSPRYPWNISQQAGPKSEDCFCGICDPFFHASFSIHYWRDTHHHLSRISPNMLTTCYRIWWTSPPNWQPVWDHQKSSNRNWWCYRITTAHGEIPNSKSVMFPPGPCARSTRSQPPSCDLVGCSTAPW